MYVCVFEFVQICLIDLATKEQSGYDHELINISCIYK